MKKVFTKKSTSANKNLKSEITISLDDSCLAVPEGVGRLPIDILEKDDEILVITPIAGMNLDTTEIIVREDTLTIRGERKLDFGVFDYCKKNYVNEECFWGSFSRSIILPSQVDSSLIEATEKDHVLFIKIPKRCRVSMRIVRIKST